MNAYSRRIRHAFMVYKPSYGDYFDLIYGNNFELTISSKLFIMLLYKLCDIVLEVNQAIKRSINGTY